MDFQADDDGVGFGRIYADQIANLQRPAALCQSVALLKHVRAAQQPFFLERRRLQLQADRQARCG